MTYVKLSGFNTCDFVSFEYLINTPRQVVAVKHSEDKIRQVSSMYKVIS